MCRRKGDVLGAPRRLTRPPPGPSDAATSCGTSAGGMRASALMLATSLVGATAQAQATGIDLSVEGSCPSAEDLRQKLEALLAPGEPLVAVAPDAPAGDAARARVRDLGEYYLVEAKDARRAIVDAAHDCAERARVAAVFVALNTGHGLVPETAEPVPAASEDGRSSHWSFGLLGVGAVVYAPEPARAAPGGGLGAFVEHGSLGVLLAFGGFAPVVLPLEASGAASGAVDLARLPVLLAGRYALAGPDLDVAPNLGIALDVMHLRGLGVERPESTWRTNVGGRLGADVRLHVGAQIAVALRFGLSAFPRAYALVVEPLGALGHAPRVWLDAGLGVEWHLAD